MFSLQRMGAHGRLAKLCAVGGVAASFALVKVDFLTTTIIGIDKMKKAVCLDANLLVQIKAIRSQIS